MRGIGFFEQLEKTPEDDDNWHALAAGLLVLRAADAAMRAREVSDWAYKETRQRVARVTDLAMHTRLRVMLDLSTAGDPSSTEWATKLGGLLLAYGIELHARGAFAPAIDVFTVVCEDCGDIPELRMSGLYHRAFSLRMLHRLDDATQNYIILRSLAMANRSVRMELDASLGLGRVMIERGNIPGAEPVIESVIARARSVGERAVVAHGLIDQAAIAGIRRDPARVLEYSHAALGDISDAYRRDRVLVNMAHALRELGRRKSAVYLATHVARSAQHADQRAFALLLLYHLAIDGNDWRQANDLAVELMSLSMTPAIQAEFHECAARHRAAVGDASAALVSLTNMLAVAEAHGMAEMIIRADAAMGDVRRGLVPALYEFRPIAQTTTHARRVVAEVEGSLEELCLAVVG